MAAASRPLTAAETAHRAASECGVEGAERQSGCNAGGKTPEQGGSVWVGYAACEAQQEEYPDAHQVAHEDDAQCGARVPPPADLTPIAPEKSPTPHKPAESRASRPPIYWLSGVGRWTAAGWVSIADG